MRYTFTFLAGAAAVCAALMTHDHPYQQISLLRRHGGDSYNDWGLTLGKRSGSPPGRRGGNSPPTGPPKNPLAGQHGGQGQRAAVGQHDPQHGTQQPAQQQGRRPGSPDPFIRPEHRDEWRTAYRSVTAGRPPGSKKPLYDSSRATQLLAAATAQRDMHEAEMNRLPAHGGPARSGSPPPSDHSMVGPPPSP